MIDNSENIINLFINAEWLSEMQHLMQKNFQLVFSGLGISRTVHQ